MEELKDIIANNLAECRKKNGMTQADVASALNYSDKAVSKWERAESLPDITVLKQLSDLYGIKVDDLMNKDLPLYLKKPKIIKLLKRHKLIIPLLSAMIVWLVATVVFVFLVIFQAPVHEWLSFIYAIPLSLIVLLVFNTIWGNKILSAVILSLVVWTVPLCLCLTIDQENIWYLFLISVPCQILTVLWYIMRVRRGKKS